jgi:hypothetical protein
VCESPKRESSLPLGVVGGEREQHVLGSYVRGAKSLRLLVGCQKRPFGVWGQRGSYILASFLSGLLFQLGADLVGVGVGL